MISTERCYTSKSIRLSPRCGGCACSSNYKLSAGSLRCYVRTMARNFWASRSRVGPSRQGWLSNTSNPASPTRMPTSSGSIAPIARNCSTYIYSRHSTMFVKPPGGGCANTTKSDPTIASMTRHPVRPIKPSETLLSNCRLDGEAYVGVTAFYSSLIKFLRFWLNCLRNFSLLSKYVLSELFDRVFNCEVGVLKILFTVFSKSIDDAI